tara:strand:- start:234 stop:629 length:396 start_codon:yes stop_codon:yes gene_type:complete
MARLSYKINKIEFYKSSKLNPTRLIKVTNPYVSIPKVVRDKLLDELRYATKKRSAKSNISHPIFIKTKKDMTQKKTKLVGAKVIDIAFFGKIINSLGWKRIKQLVYSKTIKFKIRYVIKVRLKRVIQNVNS